MLMNPILQLRGESLGVPFRILRVQESKGIDKRATSKAVCDRYGSIVEAQGMLETDGPSKVGDGRKAAQFPESMFHSKGQVDPYNLKDNKIKVECIDGPQETIVMT